MIRYSALGLSTQKFKPPLKDCGFLVGGVVGLEHSQAVNHFDFKTEAFTRYTASLSRKTAASIGISAPDAGYIAGGLDRGSNGNVTAGQSIDSLSYTTGSLTTMAYAITAPRYGNSNHGLNSFSVGYITGACVDSNNQPYYQTIEALSFETQSVYSLINSLPAMAGSPVTQQNTGYGSSLSSNTAGYLVDISNKGAEQVKLRFADDTVAVLSTATVYEFTAAAGVASLSTGYRLNYTVNSAILERQFPSFPWARVTALRFADESQSLLLTRTTVSASTVQAPLNSAGKGYAFLPTDANSVAGSAVANGIDFATEAALVLYGGKLVTSQAAGVSKFNRTRSTKSYIAGGSVIGSAGDPENGVSSVLQCFDHAIETGSIIDTGFRDQAGSHCSGVGSDLYNLGYFLGGVLHDQTVCSLLNSVDFFTNSVAPVLKSVASPKAYAVSSQSQDHGYFFGGCGLDNEAINVIDSLLFSVETYTRLSVSLSNSKQGMASVQNLNRCWLLGGSGSSRKTSPVSVIEGFHFATASTTSSGYSLPEGLEQGSGLSNLYLSNYGYMCGGYGSTGATAAVLKIGLDAGDVAVSSITLDQTGYGSVGLSGLAAGYISGGLNGSWVTSTSRVDYVTESMTAQQTGLVYPVYGASAVDDRLPDGPDSGRVMESRGYVLGCSPYQNRSPQRTVHDIDGIDFVSETAFIESAGLQQAYLTAVASLSYAYAFNGHGSNSVYFDFNNGSVGSVTHTLPVNLVFTDSASVSTTTLGLFHGYSAAWLAQSTGRYGTLTFSTETFAGLTFGLSLQRYGTIATRNKTATTAYWLGGYSSLGGVLNSVTNTDVINLSTLTGSTGSVSLSRKTSNALCATAQQQNKAYVYKGGFYSAMAAGSVGSTGVNFPPLNGYYSDLTVLAMQTDTWSSISVGVSTYPTANSPCFSSLYKGYFGEGGGTLIAALVYDTETVGTIAANVLNREDSIYPPPCVNYLA